MKELRQLVLHAVEGADQRVDQHSARLRDVLPHVKEAGAPVQKKNTASSPVNKARIDKMSVVCVEGRRVDCAGVQRRRTLGLRVRTPTL